MTSVCLYTLRLFVRCLSYVHPAGQVTSASLGALQQQSMQKICLINLGPPTVAFSVICRIVASTFNQAFCQTESHTRIVCPLQQSHQLIVSRNAKPQFSCLSCHEVKRSTTDHIYQRFKRSWSLKFDSCSYGIASSQAYKATGKSLLKTDVAHSLKRSGSARPNV